MPGSIGRVIEGTRSTANALGVYEANVEIGGVVKKGKSTFFPATMTPQQVVDSINEAYNTRSLVGGNRYRGKSKSGMDIEMILGKKNKIITVYPKIIM